jgi:hypothetical protein|eukprot:COSAG01_NODE_4083_length_5373_cov_13.157945_2_plen_283_part_00
MVKRRGKPSRTDSGESRASAALGLAMQPPPPSSSTTDGRRSSRRETDFDSPAANDASNSPLPWQDYTNPLASLGAGRGGSSGSGGDQARGSRGRSSPRASDFASLDATFEVEEVSSRKKRTKKKKPVRRSKAPAAGSPREETTANPVAVAQQRPNSGEQRQVLRSSTSSFEVEDTAVHTPSRTASVPNFQRSSAASARARAPAPGGWEAEGGGPTPLDRHLAAVRGPKSKEGGRAGKESAPHGLVRIGSQADGEHGVISVRKRMSLKMVCGLFCFDKQLRCS